MIANIQSTNSNNKDKNMENFVSINAKKSIISNLQVLKAIIMILQRFAKLFFLE